MGIYTETRVHSADKHTCIINVFKASGFLVLSDNATPRSADFAPGSLEDETLGPCAAGVIIVVSDKYAAGWTDVAYDSSGSCS